MQQYLDFMRHVKEHGTLKSDRTGTGTRSVFGYQMRFNLAEGFPLVTTKKVHMKSIIHELLWFLRGDTNIAYLKEHGVSIWDEWADANGELGPIYGYQWRSWPGRIVERQISSDDWTRLALDNDGEGYPHYDSTVKRETIDQISVVLDQIKNTPDSRRMVVSAWNVGDLDDMALHPCHCLFQFYVADGKLSCQLYQRSADIFLGVPFNIASYALLTHMMAQQAGLEVGDFVWTGGDCHLYLNHLEQADMQLACAPLPLPQLVLRKADSIFDYKFEDFELVGYQSHPAIKAPVAV